MEIEQKLEKANIIINRNLLPWDIREGRDYVHPGGIRLGVSEMTHIGMKESEMKEIAQLIKKVVIDKQNPTKVAEKVAELRKDFQEVKYCFENGMKAYEYIKLRQ